MKRFLFIICTIAFAATASFAKSGRVVIAYVTSWSHIMPDPAYVTHVFYAFGGVNETFNGINISNPERLKSIAGLKENNPELKVVLSVGGWGSGRFSEMAADETLRKSFCADCKRVIDEYNLDGIDIDWEYPGSNAANISSSPNDRQNFTLLMHDIRSAIGKASVLSIATAAWGNFYDFRDFIDDLDFVNVMSYDMGNAPTHHAALYNSDITGKGMTCEKAVNAHIEGGVPTGKLVLGLPFYGRGTQAVGNFCDFRKIADLKGYTEKWDKQASVPYLEDSNGTIVLCFDNARSLKAKCKYLKKKGLHGSMYWDYAGDDEKGTLRKTVWKNTRR